MADDLKSAVMKFAAITEVIKTGEEDALRKAGERFLEHIKEAIGTYEYGWPPLAESTVAKKSRGDTPLLETGELRDSYKYEVVNKTLYVGSDNPKALWHEFGTIRIPPRPVIAGTIEHHGRDVFETFLGRIFFDMLAGILGGQSALSAINKLKR